MADDTHRKIWQPLHPAIRDSLDPQYVAYHDAHLQYIEPDEIKDWDGSTRTKKVSLPPGGTKPITVGSIQDYDVDRFRVRVYTPTGQCDERGWPVLIWFHGGGWAVGGLNNGTDLCCWACETEGVWKPNADTAPWLTPARMEWYRKLYFTRDDHRSRWDASPNLAPEALLRKLPKTWIAVAEMDILAPEALAFGEQLRGFGVDVETLLVKGGTHSILSLHGVIDRGYQMIEDAVRHLQVTFGTG
ncbi:hypothetical protein IL306_009328 [Fusarium sp. DS 682]|nr:hypothetical protein IL306_009328 [Fusarium sp. DS 682]